MTRSGIVAAGLAAVIGCGKGGHAEKPAEPPAPAVAVAEPPAPPPSLTQSFDEATTTAAPEDSLPPPAKTLAGKPTAKLQLAVRKAWNEITFTETNGKPDPVRVVLATDAGEVEVTLLPELAPNHVRNFLALTKVGYYDGLVFERVVRQQTVVEGAGQSKIEIVTAGCPAGEGTPGLGHLGYFLKPEFTDVRHDEGTVGFLRETDDTSAGTRFYVTLGPAPLLDGRYTVVGKISRGMDVVQKIAEGKLREPEFERPETPTVIRSAKTP